MDGSRGNVTDMCLQFNFIFDRLKSVDIKTMTANGRNDTLWRLTREDAHSIPEGIWLSGQVLIEKRDADSGMEYWVREPSFSQFF